MTQRVEALINPALLTWARERAGLSPEEAAKKAQVKPDQLLSWESGDKRPTINQLRKLGKAYKRPLAVFYLPESPRDFQPMRDYRRSPGVVAGTESPELRMEIRRAWDRRDIAIELYEQIEDKSPEFSITADHHDDPEELGLQIRQYLGMTPEVQFDLQDGYEALNRWRSALEDLGVLVFQVNNVDPSEIRGFSISETPFPAIAVNARDTPLGRIFTMMHEFVHILLRNGGLCDLDEADQRPPEELHIEIFCNKAAGAALVPEQYLVQEAMVKEKGDRARWTVGEIAELATKYRVSREVLLRRLLITGKTTPACYQEMREAFEREYRARKEKSSGGFSPPYRKAISRAGRLFVRLVLDNYYQEYITAGDLSDYLDIRLNHLGKIEHEIMGYNVEFRAHR